MAKITLENGISIYYEVEGHGEAVALVQGLDRDHTGMRFQRKELAKHFQVISYDTRGTGLSDTPEGPYTCLQMADDPPVCYRLWGLKRRISSALQWAAQLPRSLPSNIRRWQAGWYCSARL